MLPYSAYEYLTNETITFLAIFALVFPIFFYLFSKFGPLIECIGRRRLRKRLASMLEECNRLSLE